MKKSLFLLYLLLGMVGYSFSQDCTSYYFLQNNKTVEMTIYNKKGKETGKQVYTISDVKNSGGTVTGTIHVEMFDKKGKSQVKGTNEIQCRNGVIMMDLKMMLPQQQQEQFSKAEAQAKEVYIEYPSHISVGDQLKDADMTIDMKTGSMQQSMTIHITDRKVEGEESITTPAGTWKCFKITYKSNVSIKTMGIGIPMHTENTEWFAPGFGVVKTESKYGSTVITAIK